MAGIRLRDPVPGHDPADAVLLQGQHRNGAVAAGPKAALQKGDGVQGAEAIARFPGLGDLPVRLLADEAVSDAVQVLQRGRVGEYNSTQGLSMQYAIFTKNSGSKAISQGFPHFCAVF